MVPDEILKANPGKHPKWIRKGTKSNPDDRTRVDAKLFEDYVRPILPKNLSENKSVTGSYDRKDCTLMFLPDERKQARDYDVQERSESHLASKARERKAAAKAKGFRVEEDRILEEGDE